MNGARNCQLVVLAIDVVIGNELSSLKTSFGFEITKWIEN